MGCELLALPQRHRQPFLGAVRSPAAGRAPRPRASTLVPFPRANCHPSQMLISIQPTPGHESTFGPSMRATVGLAYLPIEYLLLFFWGMPVGRFHFNGNT
jgi:hypothetical protein